MKKIYRVEVVVYEINIDDNGDEEIEDVVFEALVGDADGNTYTYRDIIAEELLGMTMDEICREEPEVTPDKALEDQFLAFYS